MDLFFGKILFHRHGNKEDFTEVKQDLMLTELNVVLSKYGVELARHEFAGLLGKRSPTSKCDRCGYLMLDADHWSENLEKGGIYDDLSEVIHSGHYKNGKLICTECEEWLKSTRACP